MSTDPIRIGTRDSELALWQANYAANHFNKAGFETTIVHIKSEGDLDLTTPLTEMGGKGAFTKALDDALLSKQIDVAVHSYKDLPTDYPLPLTVAAVMKREDCRDTLVAPGGTEFMDDDSVKAVIATGSNRRRAQWLHRYPNHRITNIRGNVNTRLKKVSENEWHGALFAAAGLKRIGLEDQISSYLDWMVPAPAQGAIAVMVRNDDDEIQKAARFLHHEETACCTAAERELLNEMEAGCSAPVGAFAWIEKGELCLQAVALKTDGSLRYDITTSAPINNSKGIGRDAARELLKNGAQEIMDEIIK